MTVVKYFGGEELKVEAPEDGWAWGTDKKGRRCRYWFEQLTERPWENAKHFKGPPPRPLTITIPELVDSYAEGTLCPAATDTITAMLAAHFFSESDRALLSELAMEMDAEYPVYAPPAYVRKRIETLNRLAGKLLEP